MPPRRGLGKGLDSLIPDKKVTEKVDKVKKENLPVEKKADIEKRVSSRCR